MTSLAAAVIVAGPVLPGCCQSETPAQMQLREHINKGNNLLNHRQFQEAIKEYEKAMEVEPGNQIARDNIALTHDKWGYFLFHQNNFKEARLQWEEALKVNPSHANARRNLQILEMHLKRLGLNEDGKKEDSKKKEAEQESKASENEPESKSDDKGRMQATMDTPQAPPAVILSTGGRSVSISKEGKVIDDSVSDGQSHDTTSDTYRKAAPEPVRPSVRPTYRPVVRPSVSPSASTSASTSANTSASPPPTRSAPPPETTPEVESNKSEKSENTDNADNADSSVEDTLSQLEEQILGKKRENLPILKRLEQLEIDTMGKKKSGNVKTRLKNLMKTYGL
ncbi:MAG: tetratricopeptide repeat protein [Candidatus Obscuribacterales bacterium]